MSKIRWGAGGKNSGDRRQEKRGGMGEGSGLVSTAGDGIIVDVATLVRANPYLRKTGARRRMITDCARQSSCFEGARGLKGQIHWGALSKRRRIASAKK